MRSQLKLMLLASTLGVALLTAGGCGMYAGRKFPMTLRSTPTGAEVFVIPWDRWHDERRLRRDSGLSASDDDLMRDIQFLEEFRVRDGLTDIRVRIPACSTIMVVRKGDLIARSDRFTPQPDGEKHVLLDHRP